MWITTVITHLKQWQSTKCWAFFVLTIAFSKCSTKSTPIQTGTYRHKSSGMAQFCVFCNFYCKCLEHVQKIPKEKAHHQRQARGQVYLCDDWRKQRRPNFARRVHQVLHWFEHFAIIVHFLIKYTIRTSAAPIAAPISIKVLAFWLQWLMQAAKRASCPKVMLLILSWHRLKQPPCCILRIRSILYWWSCVSLSHVLYRNFASGGGNSKPVTR